MEDCPCGGQRSPTWHYKYKVPSCEHVKAVWEKKRRQKKPLDPNYWLDGSPAGSSIYVPELEEL